MIVSVLFLFVFWFVFNVKSKAGCRVERAHPVRT